MLAAQAGVDGILISNHGGQSRVTPILTFFHLLVLGRQLEL